MGWRWVGAATIYVGSVAVEAAGGAAVVVGELLRVQWLVSGGASAGVAVYIGGVGAVAVDAVVVLVGGAWVV